MTHVTDVVVVGAGHAGCEAALASARMGCAVVLEDLRAALASLGGITGEVANDDLYDRIFSTFCIGK